MSTIYIVTEGEYSDYSIIAVFDNEEQAKELARRCKYGAEVEAWKLNPEYTDYAALGYSRFTVHMDREGTVLHMEEDKEDLFMDAARFSRQGTDMIYYHRQCKELNHRQDIDLLQMHLHLTRIEKDKAQVVKIANEKRIQLLAENRWKLYETA